MGGNASMPNSAPMCDKVKQSGCSMSNQASNTPTQGTGGGKFKTKHGVNSASSINGAIK